MREERDVEKQFGQEFLEYKRRCRHLSRDFERMHRNEESYLGN